MGVNSRRDSRSWYGWLVLLGALAVPVILFWNWWGKMQTVGRPESDKPMTSGASLRGVAQVSSMSLVSADKIPTSDSKMGAVPSAASPTRAALSSSTLSDNEMIEYNPVSTRDPTLSPFDLKAMAEEALAKRRPRRQPKQAMGKPIEDLLELQGIVATPNGIMALINGERLREGDRISGVLVKRITTRFVVFKYAGRTFSKKVE